MDRGDWGLLGGTGIIGSLVTALSVLIVRRRKSDDDFVITQNRSNASFTTKQDKLIETYEREIRELGEKLKVSEARGNKLEMHLHDWMQANKRLKRDFDKLAAIVKTSPRAEVLDWIEHSSFSPPDF